MAVVWADKRADRDIFLLSSNYKIILLSKNIILFIILASLTANNICPILRKIAFIVNISMNTSISEILLLRWKYEKLNVNIMEILLTQYCFATKNIILMFTLAFLVANQYWPNIDPILMQYSIDCNYLKCNANIG